MFQLLMLLCQRGAGVHKELGGDSTRAQTVQRDFPYRMASCSALKAGGKKEEGGDIQSDGVCLPK